MYHGANWDIVVPLSEYDRAPNDHGIYEIGVMLGVEFEPKYIGRAWHTTIRERLRSHFLGSHNPEVYRHRHEALCRWLVNSLPRTSEQFAWMITAPEWNRQPIWKRGG